MQPESEREKERKRLGSSFFALSRREHKAECGRVDRLRPLQRTRERGGVEDLQEGEEREREWREKRDGGRGKDASGRPFSAPRFNSHPSKSLSLSLLSLLDVASVRTRLSFLKIPPPPSWQSVKYGSFVMLATLH